MWGGGHINNGMIPWAFEKLMISAILIADTLFFPKRIVNFKQAAFYCWYLKNFTGSHFPLGKKCL